MKTMLAILFCLAPVMAADVPPYPRMTPATMSSAERTGPTCQVAFAENQIAFQTAFWLACDLIDESGYTGANPLPSYDWPTLKKHILPLMYFCDKAGLNADQKANIIAAIAAVKVLADEPGVDVSVVKPKP